MITSKQVNMLKYLIKSATGDIDEIKEWYERQPEHNTIHSNPDASYRDAILCDKIESADYNLVSGLIEDLEKVVYMSGEVYLDSIIDRLNNL
jgi:hypothetical protein